MNTNKSLVTKLDNYSALQLLQFIITIMLDRTKNLSEHFLLGELTKTSFKTDDNNEPPLEAVENLIHLCEDWLEELRFNYNTIYVLNAIED